MNICIYIPSFKTSSELYVNMMRMKMTMKLFFYILDGEKREREGDKQDDNLSLQL